MKHVQAIGLFILTVVLAGGIFWWLWNTQINFGRSVDGARSFGESQLKRESLAAYQLSDEAMSISARNGCCNFLERPSWGSQLMIDVAPGPGKCYEDELTQNRVKKGGFVLVDVEPQPCKKNIVI